MTPQAILLPQVLMRFLFLVKSPKLVCVLALGGLIREMSLFAVAVLITLSEEPSNLPSEDRTIQES